MPSAKNHGLLFQQASLDRSYKLNDPSPSERGAAAFMAYFNSELARIGQPITLILANTPIKIQNVYGVNRVFTGQIQDLDRQTRPKADLAFVSLINGKFREICYLSLDWVTNIGDVDFYSGLSFHADGGKIGNVSKDPEVVTFLRQLTSRVDAIAKGQSFFLPVKDRKLAGRAVFGPIYKRDTKKGKDNVDLRAEGKAFRLSKVGDGYALRGAFRLNDRDLNVYLNDQQRKVVLSAEPSPFSRFKVDGKEYKGVRVTMKPRAALDSKAQELPKETTKPKIV